ncbi:hypothetical protein SASPL_107956 [Salvia splendens]|uniref:Uncharacterized protein n=1 Tax=Salvia splendens TaxID=180675 RepID=A0A8X8YBD1_SALSN|nr:hypothetical protein SASPL_107956 [Salvia splendens]
MLHLISSRYIYWIAHGLFHHQQFINTVYPTMTTTHSPNLILLTLFMMILPLHSLFESSDAKCPPSSCGNLHNIGYPFRLKGDPKKCGNPRFELACENNVTSLSLNSHKYYVKAINSTKTFLFYNSTIRLVDASINKDNICSFPTYSPYTHNFTYPFALDNPDLIPVYPSDPYNNDKPFPINFISCPNRLSNSSLNFTDITAHCSGSNSSHHHRYAYVKVGRMKVSEMPHTCKSGVMVMTFWDFKNLSNVSLSEIHEALLYGFEFTVNPAYVISKRFITIVGSGGLILWLVVFLCLPCSAVSPPLFTICGFCAVLILILFVASVFRTDKNAVTMSAARGTIGYVAPELINRSIGVVSYKADVYSYGMLLMEMVSLKRDLTRNNGSSSQYFPYWIYDCFKEGKDIQVDGNEDNPTITKLVRKITIVALWCIQMSPDVRPSMSKVLEMLEADVERLKIPEYPSQPTQIVVNDEETGTTFSTDYVSALQNEDAPGVEISVQE